MYSFCALSIDIDRFIVAVHKPLEDFQEKEKNFFLPVPHQDAIPLPRLNDGPDFSSRQQVTCALSCAFSSSSSCRVLVATQDPAWQQIQRLPFRHKT